jgi:hypothetical protein
MGVEHGLAKQPREPISCLSVEFEGNIGEKDSGLLVPKHIHRYGAKRKTGSFPSMLVAEQRRDMRWVQYKGS